MKLETIAIIEDNDAIRNDLHHQLMEQQVASEINSYPDGETALKQLSKQPAQVVLCDLGLPGMNGIQCIATIKQQHPQTEVLVLTVYDDTENIFNAIKAGASGYLLKSTPSEKIMESISEVLSGGSPISASIARKVLQTFSIQQKGNSLFQDLGRREQEILEWLNKGYRYKEIADKLFISIETVRTHIRNIYNKLQVNSRVEALRKTGLFFRH